MTYRPTCTRQALFAVPAVLMIFVTALQAHAAECGMREAFKQTDRNARKGVTPVWADGNASSLLFVESLNVNTDGTSRSYSVDDFWGSKRALNNLCNAMSDACEGLSRDGLRQRRELTEQAAQKGWPADLLRRTRISPAIIPFKNGKPCPSKDGFLISATALHKPNVADVCDISNYADALVTPAIVLPKRPSGGAETGFARMNAKIGDLVVAMVPGTNRPVFAVVGDMGPSTELGEGSIALNGQLLGKTAPPTSYLEVTGKGQFRGKAWTVPRAAVMVFAGSRDAGNPYLTPERINETAKKRFDDWGGVERLNTCIAEYAKP